MVKPQTGIRAFYTLMITQTLSLLGSRMSGFALGIWVYTQTGNATPLALVAFFEIVPLIFLSNFAGLVADRFDRRRVMLIANLGQSIGSLLLITSFLSGSFQIWQLYVVAVIQACFSAFLQPSLQASITMLVSDKGRDRANAISQMAGPLAGVLAPGVTGVLYAIIGVTGVLVIDLITFLVAAGALLFIMIPRPEHSTAGNAARESGLSALMGGFRFLWANRILLWILLYASVVNFVFNGLLSVATPYILARTGNDTNLLGLILSVMNGAMILGSVLMGIWGGTRPRINTIVPGIIFASMGLALFGLSRNPWLLALSIFLTTFPLPFTNAAATSMLQIKVPPDLQGRVFAVVTQLAMLLSPISLVLVGPLIDKVFEPAVKTPIWTAFAPLVGDSRGSGQGLLIFGLGTILAIASVLVYMLPAVRRLERTLPDYIAVPSEPITENVTPPRELNAAR